MDSESALNGIERMSIHQDSMETPTSSSSPSSSTKPGDLIARFTTHAGLAFLHQVYQFYVIICFRCTSIYNINEIVEIGIVVTKTDDMTPLYRYSEYVKPSILKRVSWRCSTYENVKYEDLKTNFTDILRDITREQHFIGHALQNGLIIIFDEEIMDTIFPSQCSIEQALRRRRFPGKTAMAPFQQWCCLDDMYLIVRDVMENRAALKCFQDKVTNLTPDIGFEIATKCVDEALSIIPLINMYIDVLQRDLFPTKQVARPSEMFTSKPVYNSFRNHFKSSMLYHKFDKDGIYTESDSEEEEILMSSRIRRKVKRTTTEDEQVEEEILENTENT